MSKYNDTLLTTAGKALATRAANGSAKFSITRAVGSKTDLSGKTDAELVALTALPDETQVAQIVAQVDDPDGSTGITGTQVTFQNKNEGASIDEGYTLNTIGLFAKEEGSDKEILYALTTADEADYIPDFADNVFYKFTITIYVVVGQKANVTVAIDVTGTASIEYVDSAVAKAMQNLPKDIARTGVDNKFTGANDFQKATVKGVNVATAADVDNKVNIADMRKPASDVAGIEEVSTLQTQVDNSAVGTNLAIGTNQEYAMGYGIPTTTWEDGYAYLKLPANVIHDEILPQAPHTFWYTLAQGVTYTQTIWFETDATVKDLSASHITWHTVAGHDYQPLRVQKLGQNSYKLVSTYTWPSKSDNNVRLFDIENLDSAFDLSTGTYLKFGKLKLEKGSVATDWCPNPEDKVNVSDMRKPASDVAGIEEVNAKQDKIGYTPANDDNVIHRDPNTGKSEDATDFPYNSLMVDGYPVIPFVLVPDRATAITKTAQYPNYAFMYGKELS